MIRRMDHNGWQGVFGEYFIGVLTAAAGLTPLKKDIQYDGVDWNIGFPGRLGSIRYPQIEAQVKTWCDPIGDQDDFKYPLAVKNYDDLVGEVGIDFPLPRFLFVVIVPRDTSSYAFCNEDSMRLQHSAYWANIMDHPPLDQLSVTSTKTIYVPKANRLDAESLLRLLEGDRQEGAA